MGGPGALLRALVLRILYGLARGAEGALRDELLRPEVQLAARDASALLSVLLAFALAWAGWGWLRRNGRRAPLATGLAWAGAALAADLAWARALRSGWSEFAADYDPQRGGVMALALAAMALTPWLVGRLKPGAAI
jgi:TRAP-type C4-dicarboxylate transport system permease small subunit